MMIKKHLLKIILTQKEKSNNLVTPLTKKLIPKFSSNQKPLEITRNAFPWKKKNLHLRRNVLLPKCQKWIIILKYKKTILEMRPKMMPLVILLLPTSLSRWKKKIIAASIRRPELLLLTNLVPKLQNI